MPVSASRKRKRDAEEKPTDISIQVSTQDTSQVGPVLACFPALQLTKSIPYRCYINSKDEPGKPFIDRDAAIVGETDTVEFVSGPETQTAGAGCSYVVGIYNRRTNTTVLRAAPLHVLTRHVKKLKNLEAMATSIDARNELRNKLGETFGTKKAKAAIRAQERNKIDVDAMKGVASHLQDTIEENTTNLPTKEEAKATADESRLIPVFNADATDPSDVYALHDVIPEAELNAISLSALKAASSDKERRALLPFSRSDWVNGHLRVALSSNEKQTPKLLYYISTMMAFKQTARFAGNKQKLQERLKGVPAIIVDGLVSRFTETARGSNDLKLTSQSETSLLTYMFALCLRVDNYATDNALIAKDLSMDRSQVNSLFKSLGCKIEALSEGDVVRLKLPSSAQGSKHAILRVPLEFPAVRTRRARR